MRRSWPWKLRAVMGALPGIAGCGDVDLGAAPGDAGADAANPTPVVLQIATGDVTACALLGDRSVRCWGGNDGGQAGDGSRLDHGGPFRVAGLADIAALTMSRGVTCALDDQGRALCFGYNSLGQLGLPSATPWRASPAPIPGLGPIRAIRFSDATCALNVSGDVSCWGADSHGERGDGMIVPQVLDNALTFTTVPAQVEGVAGVVSLVAGGYEICAVSEQGRMSCWGFVGFDGPAKDDHPTPIDMGVAGVTQVALGGAHGCILLAGGEVRCWGSNVLGNVGDGTATVRPDPVHVFDGAKAIVAGFSHTCALRSDGTVWCWGMSGLRGDGSPYVEKYGGSTPVLVHGLSAVEEIAAGDSFTCARLHEGGVSCWGYNSHQQLGDGTTEIRTEPVSVVW